MKTAQFALALGFVLASAAARADYKAVTSGSKEDKVARIANSILAVYTLALGDYSYQIVSLDSNLNSDIGLTTMVMVGEGGVGGQAGYEAAFKLTPTENLKVLDSAKVENGKIELNFLDEDNNHVIKRLKYDPSSRVLKEEPTPRSSTETPATPAPTPAEPMPTPPLPPPKLPPASPTPSQP